MKWYSKFLLHFVSLRRRLVKSRSRNCYRNLKLSFFPHLLVQQEATFFEQVFVEVYIPFQWFFCTNTVYYLFARTNTRIRSVYEHHQHHFFINIMISTNSDVLIFHYYHPYLFFFMALNQCIYLYNSQHYLSNFNIYCHYFYSILSLLV